MLRGRSGCSLCGRRLLNRRLVLPELTVDLELDLLAHQEAAATQGDVPHESPVRAVQGPGQRSTNLGVAKRVDDHAAVLVIECELLGGVVDGEVADDPEVVAVRRDRLQCEHDLRVLRDVEEVRALEMSVALLGAGGDARCLDGDRAAPGGRVVRIIQLEIRGHLAEAAAHGCDTEVLRAEGDRCVMRVKTPRHGVYSLNAGSAPGGLGHPFVRSTHHEVKCYSLSSDPNP